MISFVLVLFQWFTTPGGDSTLGGTQTPSGVSFDGHNWESAIGIKWVEARDAACHPTAHSSASATNNDPIKKNLPVRPRLRNHGDTTSLCHSVTTDRTRECHKRWPHFVEGLRSTLDTGNLEVWRVWGHQHRPPLSHTGLPNGVEPTGKEGSQRRDGHKADRQLPDRT